jgi:hypothetical protein
MGAMPQPDAEHPDEPAQDTLARLEATVVGLRVAAARFAAAGPGGFVIQQYADWTDYPAWVDHNDVSTECDLAFPTEAAARTYLDAVVELEYRRAHADWAARHARWLPRKERFEQRQALLMAHDLWRQPGEMVPLLYPAGPGDPPRPHPERWRVVTYADSERAEWADDEPVANAAAWGLFCRACRGRVGIDVDCPHHPEAR